MKAFNVNIPFKPGDIVRPKSGGPDMTVTEAGEAVISGEPKVWCVWYSDNRTHKDAFSPDELVLCIGSAHLIDSATLPRRLRILGNGNRL